MELTRKTVLLQWLQILAGLAVFAAGVHFTIHANIGLAPWDCLGQGISLHTPLNYGLSMTCMGVAILLIDLLLGERIGFGTIIDALVTGNFVQLFNDINPLPENRSIPAGLAFQLLGFFLMALGQVIYMKAAQCCGPRDALLVGVGKRMPKVPIGFVAVMVWGAALLLGWLLGGQVGIGTLFSTAGAGLVMQLVNRILHFEPRSVRHVDVVKASKALLHASVSLSAT
ncbi:MAG: hypothetical protein IJJ85_08500 [Clostridia bacterium]|nr:hypothetical protein [Clostridia bacterium]